MSSTVTTTSHIDFLLSRGGVLDESGQIADHFGDHEKELDAFASSAALLDRYAATCLIQEGADALDLLHRLTTNDLISLERGDARFTVLTSERGRVIDVVHVALLANDRLMLLSESPHTQQTIEWIEKFTIIEDSKVQDVSRDMTRLALIGPTAFEVAQTVFGVEPIRGRASILSENQDQTVLVASQWAGNDRVDITIPRTKLEATWDALSNAGAVPAGDTSFQAARINGGVPLAGSELNDGTNPLEVRLKGTISFTKGCYVGQEVVARLDTYDKLQRRLVAFESSSNLTADLKLSSDGKRAGTVTSISPISAKGQVLALGFARRDFWADGTALEFDGGTVTVRGLIEISPFA